MVAQGGSECQGVCDRECVTAQSTHRKVRLCLCVLCDTFEPSDSVGVGGCALRHAMCVGVWVACCSVAFRNG